jgi:hypothetical protein
MSDENIQPPETPPSAAPEETPPVVESPPPVEQSAPPAPVGDPILDAGTKWSVSREEQEGLPDPAKKLVANFQRDYHDKTRKLADERKQLEAERAQVRKAADSLLGLNGVDFNHEGITKVLQMLHDPNAPIPPLEGKDPLEDLTDDDLLDPEKVRRVLRAFREEAHGNTHRAVRTVLKEVYEPTRAAIEQRNAEALLEQYVYKDYPDARNQEHFPGLATVKQELGLPDKGYPVQDARAVAAVYFSIPESERAHVIAYARGLDQRHTLEERVAKAIAWHNRASAAPPPAAPPPAAPPPASQTPKNLLDLGRESAALNQARFTHGSGTALPKGPPGLSASEKREWIMNNSRAREALSSAKSPAEEREVFRKLFGQ